MSGFAISAFVWIAIANASETARRLLLNLQKRPLLELTDLPLFRVQKIFHNPKDTTRYDAILPRSLPHLIERRLKATVASGVCGDGGCRGECVRAQHYMR
jgi:hypothetical protein